MRQGQPAASDALQPRGRARSDLPSASDPQFPARQNPQGRDRRETDQQTRRGEFCPLGVSTSAYVGREHKQQRPADPTCRAIGHFGGGPAAPELLIEPPDQHACRNEFDQAIRAERDQADAARPHTRGKGDDSLDDHSPRRPRWAVTGRAEARRSFHPHSNRRFREELHELGRADDGVGDVGLDQFLLGEFGAEIAIVGPIDCNDRERDMAADARG
jgi:hypothetical protein